MEHTHIILLRGVMPTGKNKVPMARLREITLEAGYGRVQTWIQSGNLLLESEKDKEETAEHIRRLIRERIGPDLAVIIRSPEEILRALRECPFQTGFLPERVFYAFPQSPLTREAIAGLQALVFDGEEDLRFGPGCLYLYIPGSAARTRLNNALLERISKTAFTTRNLNTLSRLVQLCGAVGEPTDSDQSVIALRAARNRGVIDSQQNG